MKTNRNIHEIIKRTQPQTNNFTDSHNHQRSYSVNDSPRLTSGTNFL